MMDTLQICCVLLMFITNQHYVHGKFFNLEAPEHTFTSVGFDHTKSYSNFINDNWKLTVKSGFRVVLYFTEFDIEDSFLVVPCALDYVEIIDGEHTSNATFGRFCGNPKLYSEDAPRLVHQKFKSTGSVMTVIMKSDYSNDTPDQPQPVGFRAHFHAEDINECDIPIPSNLEFGQQYEYSGRCEHFCNNILGSYYCSCKSGYRLADDGFNCIGICGDTITAPHGAITTPGYPDHYPRLTDCTWSISTDPGKTVSIHFEEEFAIEEYLNTGRCAYDWIKIRDSSGELGTYCGNSLPEDGLIISSATNWIEIDFHSDYLTEKNGFKLVYQSKGIQCLIPDPPSFGYVKPSDIVKLNGNSYVPFGGFLKFGCESGFRLRGAKTAACLKDGTISDHTPICEAF